MFFITAPVAKTGLETNSCIFYCYCSIGKRIGIINSRTIPTAVLLLAILYNSELVPTAVLNERSYYNTMFVRPTGILLSR